MPDHLTFASEQEVEELREQVRRLREEQARQKESQHKLEDRDGEDKQGGEDKAGKEENENGQGGEEGDGEKDEKKESHPLRTVLIVAGVLLIAIIALLWWLHARQFESTDDATIDGHISGIAARVEGTITGVYFEENQFVKAGQTLVDLDPRDYQVAVRQARSGLRQAQGQVDAEQPNVAVTQVTSQTNISTTESEVVAATADLAAAQRNHDAAVAKVAEGEANNAKAQADVERFRPLAAKDEVPRQQFDEVIANAKALAATLAANEATAQANLKQVEKARAQLTQAQQKAAEARENAPRQIAIRQANVVARQASVEAAQAQVDQAMLNASYIKIWTPVSGIIAKRTAEVGQHVAPGQQVALVTQLDDLWVTANYKETQLQRMNSGQSVRVYVDALDETYDGYIESLPAASGAVTSLLPPENASGNFVKVVQRLPVRIRFKKDQAGLERLRPGMSAEPKTRVR